MFYLDCNSLPEYCFSSFRYFNKGEKHISRICGENVLLFIFKGILKFSENGEKITVCENEYYIQRAGMFQTAQEESEEPQYYYIHFKGNFLQNNEGIPIRGKYKFSNFIECFNLLEIYKNTAKSTLEKNKIFYEILSKLIGLKKTQTSLNPLAEKIKNYLIQNYMNKIEIENLMNEFSYSKNYIINVFKHEYGITPYKFLTELRLEQAKKLLQYSDLSCQSISDACGFSDYSVFYKSFYQAFNNSPAKWRLHIAQQSSM